MLDPVLKRNLSWYQTTANTYTVISCTVLRNQTIIKRSVCLYKITTVKVFELCSMKTKEENTLPCRHFYKESIHKQKNISEVRSYQELEFLQLLKVTKYTCIHKSEYILLFKLHQIFVVKISKHRVAIQTQHEGPITLLDFNKLLPLLTFQVGIQML